MKDGFIVFDNQGFIEDVNSAFCRMTGFTREELIGTGPPHRFWPEEEKENQGEAFRKMLQGVFDEVELTYRSKTGERFPVVFSPSCLRDKKANIVHCFATVKDITEHKRAEDALERRDAVLEAVSFASEHFLKAVQWDADVREVLKQLGLATGVSRVYVYEAGAAEDGAPVVSQRFEWVLPGIEPSIDKPELQNFRYEEAGFGAWVEALLNGEAVHFRVRDLPPRVRTLFEGGRVLSVLLAPVLVEGQTWGIIGFEDCLQERAWSAPEIDAIKAAAGTLGAAIQHQRTRETLRQTNEMFNAVLESAPLPILTLDRGGRVDFIWNPAAERILGWKREEVLGEVLPTVPEDKKEEFARNLERALSGKELLDLEARRQRRDGSPIDYEIYTAPRHDAEGTVVGVTAVLVDITERKRADKLLKESEGELRIMADNVPGLFSHVDADGRYRFVNKEYAAWFGVPREDIVGKHYREILGEGVAGAIEGYVKSVMTGKRVDYDARLPYVHGDPRWVHASYIPDIGEEGTTKGFFALVRDITRSKQVEERLQVYQQELRTLASELSRTEDRERRRIATFLHDEIGQSLAVVRMKFGAFKGALGSGKAAQQLDDIGALLERTIQHTRSLTFELSPPILYELGLEPALEWLGETICEAHDLRVEFEDDGLGKPLDDDVRAVLYRAARELLMNVVKHAQARLCKIGVWREGDHVRITVEDDGVGFDTHDSESEKRPRGYGLFNVHERLDHIGGRFEIESEPGRGTRAILSAPLKGVATGAKGDRP